MYRCISTHGRKLMIIAVLLISPAAGAVAEPAQVSPASESMLEDILSERQWAELDGCVDRALEWLASQQQQDGTFPTLPVGQPAVTAICVLAFLSAGHLPGGGRYGAVLDRAVEYILDSQSPDGLISRRRPPPRSGFIQTAQTSAYNHSIGALALSELYGMHAHHNPRMKTAIEAALAYTLKHHPLPKRQAADGGGWRYLVHHQSSDSDLSVTSWSLMFLRSCKNSGFEVPSAVIDDGVAYVLRCFDPRRTFFRYALHGQEAGRTGRAITAVGVLSLSLGGRHQTPEALQAADWLLRHPYDRYRQAVEPDRFFYGVFYSSHAMFQLGGRYWAETYPIHLRILVQNQHSAGSWDPETGNNSMYGNVYSTAMAVLALSPPYQVLPVFQR